MKKILSLLLVAFLVCPAGDVFSAVAVEQKYERILTLDECIRLATNINYDVLINKESVLLAEQRMKEAKSLYFPTLDFNFNISRFSNDVATTINSHSLPAIIVLPDGNREYFYSTKLSLWQNIYNGGRTKATNKLAKLNYEKTQNNSEIKKNEVIGNVRINFYKNLATKEKIKVYKKYLKKNKSSVLKNKLEILQHQYEMDLLDFLALIGLELDAKIDIDGKFEAEKLDLNLQQCILWAYQFRPEIKTTQYQETMDNISVNLIYMEKFPTLMLGAAYDYLGDDTDQKEKDWYVSLNLNFPIFEGGAMFSRLKQNKIKARKSAIERSQIEEKIKLEVRKAYSEYEFWYGKVSKIKNVKVSSLEQELLNIDIKYNYMKSLIELGLAVGKQ